MKKSNICSTIIAAFVFGAFFAAFLYEAFKPQDPVILFSDDFIHWAAEEDAKEFEIIEIDFEHLK